MDLALPAGEWSRPEQFQEKWEPVFRPELRENKELVRIVNSVKR